MNYKAGFWFPDTERLDDYIEEFKRGLPNKDSELEIMFMFPQKLTIYDKEKYRIIFKITD